jgi:two-component system LytT family response regulator
MKLNCIIIDDEPTARFGLEEDLREIDFLKIQGTASNAFEALEMIKNYSPELIFLDIEMPGLSGLDFLRLIKVNPMVILTTAYPEYALDGYELGVVDYLLKPIAFERLRLACDKAFQLYSYRNQQLVIGPPPEYFFVKCNGKMEKIDLAEILYIEAANNYIFIHTKAKRFMSYHTLKGIDDQLPKNKFVRVHKSYIVSKDHIQQIDKNEIVINQLRIPLSKNFKNNFQKDFVATKSFRR